MITISIQEYKKLADAIAANRQSVGRAFILTPWGAITVHYRKGGTPHMSDVWCEITGVNASLDDCPDTRLISTDFDARKLENMVLQELISV